MEVGDESGHGNGRDIATAGTATRRARDSLRFAANHALKQIEYRYLEEQWTVNRSWTEMLPSSRRAAPPGWFNRPPGRAGIARIASEWIARIVGERTARIVSQ